jgi:hypothetical protein
MSRAAIKDWLAKTTAERKKEELQLPKELLEAVHRFARVR